MFTVYRIIIFLSIIFSVSLVTAQEETPHYNLKEGEKYFIKQVMNQNTETESQALRGNVSLDINCDILFEVIEQTPEMNYLLSCRYTKLGLSFFSPQSDISLSSRNSAFNPLRAYLSKLEEHPFHILMSPYGEMIQIYELDSIINDFYLEKDYDAEKNGVILKTVKEAFGPQAFRSLVNIAMNVYSARPSDKNIKVSSISFNAGVIEITNNLFYNALDNNKLRIQGIGVLQETESFYENDDMSLVINLKGNQTYDYLFDMHSGWILEGISKQKIHSLSVISGHKDLPTGLKIPSFTESEYQFTGGRIPNSN